MTYSNLTTEPRLRTVTHNYIILNRTDYGKFFKIPSLTNRTFKLISLTPSARHVMAITVYVWMCVTKSYMYCWSSWP